MQNNIIRRQVCPSGLTEDRSFTLALQGLIRPGQQVSPAQMRKLYLILSIKTGAPPEVHASKKFAGERLALALKPMGKVQNTR